MLLSGVLLWLNLKRRCMAAAQAGGENPIPVSCPPTLPPQLTLLAPATPKPRGTRRRGSAQQLSEPGHSPVSPPSHSPSAPQGAEPIRDLLPAHGGHLPPHQGRSPRGCRHRDDAAHEGRHCLIMPDPPCKLMFWGSHQAPVIPPFSLIHFPEDCKAAGHFETSR